METKSLIPLIDLDGVVYSVGFASQTGRGDSVEPSPLSHCIHSCKLAVTKVLDQFPEAEERRLFLTGKGNFRDQVATLQVYKGNRLDAEKPYYYQQIRDYFQDQWEAEVVDGIEADDALAIAQTSEYGPRRSVIVTIDKDLYQVEGWKLNRSSGELKYISEAEGDWRFYRQVLTGDRVDNIPGLKGIGNAKASKILQGIRGRDRLYKVCLDKYKEMCQYPNPREAMHEIATLLYLKRSEDDMWEPPL